MRSLLTMLALVSSIPLPGLLAIPRPSSRELDTMLLADFTTDAEAVSAWRPIHDGVMGGASRGRVESTDDGASFQGSVSLENNGGFASFRMGVEWPGLASQGGLRLRLLGDGQTYKLSLRTDGAWDGVSWQASFATLPQEWTTVDVAFEDLLPTWHGRLVPEAPPFDPARIRQVGILISDKQQGPFSLTLASLEAWSALADGAVEGSRAMALARGHRMAAALDASLDARDLVLSSRWEERFLVVAASDGSDAWVSEQLGLLNAEADAVAARDLRVVLLLGTRSGRMAGRTLSAEAARRLRTHWALPADQPTVALIGKDGDVKARWFRAVLPAEVFGRIDAMPMRRDEMADRGSP